MPPFDLVDRKAGELREERLRAAADAMTTPEPLSLAQRDAILPPEVQAAQQDAVGPNGWMRLLHDWKYWARPTQLPPPRFLIWLILSGRGWGKTRTSLEWLKDGIDRGVANPFGLIGPTNKDTMDRLVYGDAGGPGLVRLYDHFPEAMRPRVNKNHHTIYFPHTDTTGYWFTAEKPEVRGPNMRRWVCDELAQWPYLRECLDNLEMTNRAPGATPPQLCLTTTPRPLDVIKELLDDPSVYVTFGSTFANAANLHPDWIRRMFAKYAGSRLGLQEMYGLLLGDNPDSLYHQGAIDDARRTTAPKLKRIAIGVDPAISATKRSDLTGIVVVGIGVDDELYVLLDLTGVELDATKPGLHYWRGHEPKKHKPHEWGELVVRAYRHCVAEFGCPVFVVGERDRGGDLVQSNVQQLDKLSGGAGAIPYKEVKAHRGKAARAEESSTLYEQGRVHHVGQLPQLETEMTDWNPKLTLVSPNRIDGLVWAIFFLMPELANMKAEPDHAGLFAGFAEAQEQMPTPGYGGASTDYDAA